MAFFGRMVIASIIPNCLKMRHAYSMTHVLIRDTQERDTEKAM
jgi:hypothetical protein